MVLQAFSWAQYYPETYPGAPFPSRAEMQKMRDLAITHGEPGMLLWYAYNDILDSANPKSTGRRARGGLRPPHPDAGHPLALRRATASRSASRSAPIPSCARSGSWSTAS